MLRKMKSFLGKYDWRLVSLALLGAVVVFAICTADNLQAQSSNRVEGTMVCYSGGQEIAVIPIVAGPRVGSQSRVMTVQKSNGTSVTTNADCIVTYRPQ